METYETPYRRTNAELFIERDRLLGELGELGEPSEGDKNELIRIHRIQRRIEDITREIVESNYELVTSYVKRFTRTARVEDAKDFESAGVLGLMRAINDYDPAMGPFEQWAYKPIQREVLRAVHARKTADYDTNLDSVLPAGDPSVEDQVLSGIDLHTLESLGLTNLGPRELYVLTRRLGLDAEPPQRLSSLGEYLGLSREAVRQIQMRAVSKLSHPNVLRGLIRNDR